MRDKNKFIQYEWNKEKVDTYDLFENDWIFFVLYLTRKNEHGGYIVNKIFNEVCFVVGCVWYGRGVSFEMVRVDLYLML